MQLVHDEAMAAALARALDEWLVREWLDRDPPFRAWIVVPVQNAELAVAEIERCAADGDFAQVLVLARTDEPLGSRRAFARFPELKVVTIEGGFGWLPPSTWRLDNHWPRAHADVPEATGPPSVERLLESLCLDESYVFVEL